MPDIVIVNTHPIQYFAPFYKVLNQKCPYDFTVLYASKKGLKAYHDEEFNREFKWDIELLDGYDSVFIDEAEYNALQKDEKYDITSLGRNLDILDPRVVVVHGYFDPTALEAIKWASKNKRRILMRGDSWDGSKKYNIWLKNVMKKIWFRSSILPCVSDYLPVGIRNAQYWQKLGAKKQQLCMVRYGVDRSKFKPLKDRQDKIKLKKMHGLKDDLPVISYIGKIIEKKGIVQLMRYMHHSIKEPLTAQFIIVGDGILKTELNRLCRVVFIDSHDFGFSNQENINEYYQLSDLIIVPSLYNETWGFVVQEALACGIPVAVSSSVGCVPDLMQNEYNGWILEANKWVQWYEFMRSWANGEKAIPDRNMLSTSQNIIGYEESADEMVSCFKKIFENSNDL